MICNHRTYNRKYAKNHSIQMTEDTQIAVDHQMVDIRNHKKSDNQKSMIIEKAIIKPWEP
jgi:hypothetical protein